MGVTVEQVMALSSHATNLGEELPEPLLPFAGSDGTAAALDDKVIKAYATLCRKLHPVNGRTVLAMEEFKSSWQTPILWILNLYTIGFAFLALSSEMLPLFLTGQQSEGMIKEFADYLILPLGPFFWAGLGSCIYLLKHISDLLESRAFDPRRLKGWNTRIVLGAVLGGVLEYVFDLGVATDAGFDINAVAFLAGLGVKVVYGAIERVVAELANRINVEAIDHKKVLQFDDLLAKEHAETDPKTDDQYYKALQEFLAARAKHRTANA